MSGFAGVQNWKHWNSKFKTLISEVTSEQQHYNIQMVARCMINKKFLKFLFHVAKKFELCCKSISILEFNLLIICNVPSSYAPWLKKVNLSLVRFLVGLMNHIYGRCSPQHFIFKHGECAPRNYNFVGK